MYLRQAYKTSWKCFTLVLIFLGGIVAHAQTLNPKYQKAFQEAVQLNMLGNPSEALKGLNKILKKDPTYVDAYWLASEILFLQGDSLGQITYLKNACKPQYVKYDKSVLRLLNTWYLRGEYEEAKNFLLEKDSSLAPNSSLKALTKRIDFALSSKSKPNGAVLHDPDRKLNTPWHDYWPSLSIDGKQMVTSVLVCDTMPDGKTFCQEDIYYSTKSPKGWAFVKPVGKMLNTDMNEGGHCLTADGNYLFFTACNRMDGMGSCDIYYCHKSNGKWSLPMLCPAPINTKYWDGHPSVSTNGSDVFFSSARPGGQGAKDLYKAKISYFPDGQLSFDRVANLGPTVNTSGDEISPFIHFDGKTLFFSSDGHVGLGRQDIFKISKQGKAWSKPVNLGYPINTHHDEIGFAVEANGKTAWMAAERNGHKDKDVFSLLLPQQLRPYEVVYYQGIVQDKTTDKPLSASVDLYDFTSDKPSVALFSDYKTGSFLVCLQVGARYAFHIKKSGYLFYSQFVNINKAGNSGTPFKSVIKLEPIEFGNIMLLDNVFFETGSYELKPESEPELQQLKLLFEENPELRIEIRGHTDSVGQLDYNLKLSSDRARSVYDYLVENGIKKWRLQYKGYGPNEPIDTNNTEAGRARNRRTEAMIIK